MFSIYLAFLLRNADYLIGIKQRELKYYQKTSTSVFKHLAGSN